MEPLRRGVNADRVTIDSVLVAPIFGIVADRTPGINSDYRLEMDRRTKSRLDVQLTCYVAAGKLQAAPVRAFTENVSRTGMLMRWMDAHPLPKVGNKLTLEVQLPENSEFGPRVMCCRATVVRVEKGLPKGDEIGLKIHSMRFVKAKAAPNAVDLASMPMSTDRVS
jgi:hypothetical protein